MGGGSACAPGQRGELPRWLIIGAAKAATTSVHDYMSKLTCAQIDPKAHTGVERNVWNGGRGHPKSAEGVVSWWNGT